MITLPMEDTMRNPVSLPSRVNGIFVDVTESTMTFIKDYHLVGEKEVFYVSADKQLSGMGRKGRIWVSPKGGLYLTIVKKPVLKPLYYQAVAAVSVAEVISEVYGYRPKIKWPNDIYTSDYTRKIGGILIKYQEKNGQGRIGVGIGINVNNEISGELENRAASLRQLTDLYIDTRVLACRVVYRLLVNEYKLMATEDAIDAYRKWAPMEGLLIKIAETREKAIVAKITQDLELEVIKLGNGERVVLKDESIEIIR